MASEATRLRGENLSLAALSLGSGCIDVLSFLGLGDVFTSAMTGNTALLAIAIGHGRLLAASRSLCSLIGFTLGVLLAALLQPPASAGLTALGVLRRLLLIELAFLTSCALLWNLTRDPVQGLAVYVVIALASLSMGIQAVGARSINSSGISTIVFTTGLIHIVMNATRRLTGRGAVPPRHEGHGHLFAFGAYGCGAVLAAVFFARHMQLMIWVPVIAVVFALGVAWLVEGRRGSPA